jgi:hypothetical protein
MYTHASIELPVGRLSEYGEADGKEMIENQRTNATSAVKKGFRGKTIM